MATLTMDLPDKLAASDFPVMTMAETPAEVNAVRSQRRRHAAGA